MKSDAKSVGTVAAVFVGVILSGTALAADAKAKSKAKVTEPKPTDKGECHGVNSCKGKGECGGPGWDCAGNNTCKGQGWITTTAADCKKQAGKFKVDVKG